MPAIKNPSVRTYFPDNKTSFGQHQAYHVLPYTIDRTNLFTGKVELHVFEDWSDPNLDLMDLQYGTDQVGADAGIRDMASSPGKGYPLCVGIERRYDEANSMAIYTYTFEGIATKHGQKFKEFELEFTMEQAPIETHPSFQTLNDIYGPYDSLNRLWPAIVTEASAAAGLQQASSSGGPITNPMYGVTSFLVPGCYYRVTYTFPDVGTDLLSGVGMISDNPDKDGDLSKLMSQFGSTVASPSDGRNWLKMAPKVRQHGGCVVIQLEWQLSGVRGWNKKIYNKDAFKLKQ